MKITYFLYVVGKFLNSTPSDILLYLLDSMITLCNAPLCCALVLYNRQIKLIREVQVAEFCPFSQSPTAVKV